MSDMQLITADLAVPEMSLPSMTVTMETRGQGDAATQVIKVAWGDPRRSIVVKELGLGDQFDLAETTGPNAANAIWVNMATVAASVQDIDGVPVLRDFSRKNLKATLDRLGMDGLRAGMMALNGYRTTEASTEAHRTAVGNRWATPDSRRVCCWPRTGWPGQRRSTGAKRGVRRR